MTKLPDTIAMPPAVDLHVHFRWPSPINKSEDYESGTKDAALSGYGAVYDMPNTQGRPTWSWQEANFKQQGIMEKAWIPMGVYAGSQLDKNNEPTNLDELEAMSKDCAALKIYFGLTTGNEDIKDVDVWAFEPIIKKWHELAPDKPIMVHRGDADLNEIIRMIAAKYNHPLHICHVNSPEEVKIIKNAKRIDANLQITCGVTPHHLFKTSHEVMTGGWEKRMQPPLAHQDDAEELWRMLVDGDIDIIETDHAPHPPENKRQAELLNPHGEETAEPGATCYGVRGIKETMPQLLYQERLGRISLERLVEVTSNKPAEIIGLTITPDSRVTYVRELGQIEDATSIYAGNMTGGKVLHSIIRSTLVVKAGELNERAQYTIKSRGDSI
jgi:dihydroorotase